LKIEILVFEIKSVQHSHYKSQEVNTCSYIYKFNNCNPFKINTNQSYNEKERKATLTKLPKTECIDSGPSIEYFEISHAQSSEGIKYNPSLLFF
jgi:hypothetical protein